MKVLKSYLPEIYFALAILYYWSLTALIINYIAIGLLIILGILILTKNNTLGIVISCILILLNLYLVLALLSEFSEFETFNANAKKLLGIGVLFIGSNLFFAFRLLFKYLKAQVKKESKVLKVSKNH
ncbi:hypothetical protein [Ichthyenterobacterium magnum]|nr:hypothetical protein [Ichthyenterobacterium magnum]